MGVTGLWQILQPCARPIKLETLNRKRLAVDASIWIYQFLKAVRDKEGNALRNSHVVGFFRRICKLLFFGIKPVFVFDGGAPVLKRQTIMGRKKRREGRREDAVRTAGRLLAMQMQRAAEDEEKSRRERNNRVEEEVVDEANLVYVDEIHMSAQERQQNRKFKKKDQYHLPDLDVSMNAMGAPNDPRIMSLEELEAYARQFDTGEDINVYDFSKIDYDSPFFTSLPASDRYNILNAARLRSRLRMGHSKEQLDTMFPDRMAFSRFQIERVTERNELTQRLMNINDPSGDLEFGINGTGRIAGEKGREYVLVKNDGVEGGWALGVVSNEGKAEKPIDLDRPAPLFKREASSGSDDFEDVPIEGLNRLPKRRGEDSDRLPTKKRKSTYRSRGLTASRKKYTKKPRVVDENSLFVAEKSPSPEEDAEADESGASLFGDEENGEDEDEELNRAIAMSLQQDQGTPQESEEEHEDLLDTFVQSAVGDAAPITGGNYRAIANTLNKRAHAAAPDSREITSFGVPVVRDESASSDDEMVDFQAAMVKSKIHKPTPVSPKKPRIKPAVPSKPIDTAKDIAKKAGFSGPLPFEKLDLGSSLLGKKKMQERTEEAQGGFIDPKDDTKTPLPAGPLPPWFSGDLKEDLKRQKAIEAEDRDKTRQYNQEFQFEQIPRSLMRSDTGLIIDLDEEDDTRDGKTDKEVIVLDKEDEDEAVVQIGSSERQAPENDLSSEHDASISEALPLSKSRNVQKTDDEGRAAVVERLANEAPMLDQDDEEEMPPGDDADGSDKLEWSDTDDEKTIVTPPAPQVASVSVKATVTEPARPIPVVSEPVNENHAPDEVRRSRSASIDFEDVDLSGSTTKPLDKPTKANDQVVSVPEMTRHETIPDDGDFDDFSDPEEEELLKALTLEAEEHARFASSLNNKSQAQNIAEYEKELKQLRNQQKKDRRDADEVTHVMIQECQQLLRLFGLPYVTAPMEAEAQCAELVRLGLVDGIVTDDSDCFLFGATRVYKNMFNQAKFVECYLHSDLEKEFDLNRQKMIEIAQLLGSDYTEGLAGVGPVTALEIIGEFQNLEQFKDWLVGVQLQQITKEDDKDHPFRKKFRKAATKLILPHAFPDARVEMAYLQPEVDSDPEVFQWGVPDLAALRSFLMATIGWTAERTDEVLVPVIRDMNRREDEGTQANITAFFDGSVGVGAAGVVTNGAGTEAFAPRKRTEGSKRMGKALGRMAEQAKTTRAKRRGAPAQ